MSWRWLAKEEIALVKGNSQAHWHKFQDKKLPEYRTQAGITCFLSFLSPAKYFRW